MNTLLLLAGIILLFFIIAETLYIVRHVRIAQDLGKKVKPFSQYVFDPQKRVLILGDSIALGTGTTEHKHSLSGRFAADHPRAEIINLSENALMVSHVAKKVGDIPDGALGHFDIVVIKVGGMDVLALKNTKKLGDEFRKLLDATRQKLCPTGQVILLSPGNVGGTKLYRHFPLGVLYSWRSRKLHNELSHIVREKNITYVDLYTKPKNDPWATNPALLAKDRIHPNDKGYELLYEYVRHALSQTSESLR